MDARSPTWPLKHAANVFSQWGDDGVAEAILNELPDRNDWVVEFGAWDGLHLSNSRHFIINKGFSAVLIEASEKRFSQLAARYADNPKVHPINAWVRTSGADTLDALLAGTPIPKDFDYLSIDIDGNDYHVWASLEEYRPKLLCIEFNATIASEVLFVQPDDFDVKQGTSARAFNELAQAKGYQLAAVTTGNLFFVRGDLFEHLGISDNSIETLRTDTSYVTHLFSGYDGTVFTTGNGELPWHRVPLRVSTHQDLPKILRKFPLDYGPGRKALFYGYVVARHPRHLARRVGVRLRRRSGR
jgi:hypothetical protein